jgi:hypothetical protein
MFCYVMLCYVMLCYVMLCYVNTFNHVACGEQRDTCCRGASVTFDFTTMCCLLRLPFLHTNYPSNTHAWFRDWPSNTSSNFFVLSCFDDPSNTQSHNRSQDSSIAAEDAAKELSKELGDALPVPCYAILCDAFVCYATHFWRACPQLPIRSLCLLAPTNCTLSIVTQHNVTQRNATCLLLGAPQSLEHSPCGRGFQGGLPASQDLGRPQVASIAFLASLVSCLSPTPQLQAVLPPVPFRWHALMLVCSFGRLLVCPLTRALIYTIFSIARLCWLRLSVTQSTRRNSWG